MSLPEQMPLTELFKEMFGDAIALPAALVPILERVYEHQGLPPGERLVTARAPDGDGSGGRPVDVVFLMTKLVGQSVTAMLLDVRLDFDGSDLPLVGETMPPMSMGFPGLKILCFDRELNVSELDQINALLATYGVAGAPFPRPNAMSGHIWPKYFAAAVTWHLWGGEMPNLALWYDDEDGEDDEKPKPKEIPVPGLPKTLGTLTISGVRGGWDKKREHLQIFLLGEVAVAGHWFTLDGLGFKVPLSLKGFVPKPWLIGAGLRMHRPVPRLSIDAALRYTGLGDDATSFGLAGLVRVETNALTAMGAGGWSQTTDGHPMIFLYVEALLAKGASLFGPPPFTVIGLSGGFGINGRLRPPEVTQFPGFPLMARLDEAPPSPGEDPPEPPDPLDVLNTLTGTGGWVRPESDSYWLAAGVTFTSFRFIETKALAVVEFGNRLNVMLLGRTSITLPKNADKAKKAHARLNIDLRLAYLSEEYKLSLEAAVAPGSFIFTEAAELTGGVAFAVWTGGGRGGDFVVTLGGYHPQFAVTMPSYYPRPARLGFRWEPCGKVVVQAGGYTALTTGAVMFGGALAARYESGMLSAWFTAHLDALIQWKPFYLDLALGISIGVAATIKIWFVKVRVSIEVGIDLRLWTPPTGGRVSVKVWFIEFGFGFGASRQGAPPVPWSEFQMQLPSPVRNNATKGMLLDVDKGEKAARDARKAPLLVSTAGFAFATEAAMPSSHVIVNGDETFTGSPIDIRPMRLTGVTSKHFVTITRFEDGSEQPFDPVENDWKITGRYGDLPAAMWGKPLGRPEDAIGKPGLITGQLTGIDVEVPPPVLGDQIGPVSSKALGFEPLEDTGLPLRDADASGPVPEVDEESISLIAQTLTAPSVVVCRTAVHAALTRLSADPGKDTDGTLGHYAELVGRSMTSSPLVTDAPAPGR